MAGRTEGDSAAGLRRAHMRLPPWREEVQDGGLIDHMDTKDSGFSADDGDNRKKALKGLYFRIASKSKF